MKLFHMCFLILAVGMLCLVGCGPDENSISQTVVSQVAAAVAETVVAQPTATLYPTQTPYDTATPYATYTPLATAVPPNTATPYPSYTPYPTYTAVATVEPTLTTTTAVTATPQPQTTASAAQPAATAPAAVDQRTQLLATLESVLRDVETMQGALRPLVTNNSTINPQITILPTNCAALTAAYNRVANVLTLNTAASPPAVQNAYNLYRAGVEAILSTLSTRTEECRAFMASGSESTVMGQTEFTAVVVSLRDPINWLNQAANDLRQE